MTSEVNDFGYMEPHVVFVPEQINLLLVVQYEQALYDALAIVILNVFTVWLEGDEQPSSQLIDLFLGDRIFASWVELNLHDFVDVATAFCVVHLLVVASHHVTADHVLWIAHHFEEVAVERRLYY